MNMKVIKIIGCVATIVSFGLSLVSDWVGEKKQDAIIDEKVNEALAKRSEKEES